MDDYVRQGAVLRYVVAGVDGELVVAVSTGDFRTVVAGGDVFGQLAVDMAAV